MPKTAPTTQNDGETRDWEWQKERTRFEGDYPTDEGTRLPFAESLTMAYDYLLTAIVELEHDRELKSAMASVKISIRATADALGDTDVDRERWGSIEEALDRMHFCRRLMKQLKAEEALGAIENAAQLLQEVLDELEGGESVTSDEYRAGGDWAKERRRRAEQAADVLLGEDDLDHPAVRCPTYITYGREENAAAGGWTPDSAFGWIEKAHDQIRGALEEVAGNDNPGSAVGLLMTGAGALGRAASELRDEADDIMIPSDQSLRDIALLLDIEDAPVPLKEVRGSRSEDALSTAVRLSDDLIRPKEHLELLETAVQEAHRRDRRFSEMLGHRIADVRRDLEKAQERAAERLQERRGTIQEALNSRASEADGKRQAVADPARDRETPIYTLDWANERRRYSAGDWPTREESLDSVRSLEVAHDNCLFAQRKLDQLRMDDAMENLRDALLRLDDVRGSFEGAATEVTIRTAANELEDARSALKCLQIPEAEGAVSRARTRLAEELDILARDEGVRGDGDQEN